MQIKLKTDKEIAEKYILFSIAYFPWLISWMFTSSYFKSYIHPYAIIRVWQCVGTVFLALKIFKSRVWNRWLFFVGIGILIIGGNVSYKNENASFIFYTLLLIVSSYDLDIRWIIKKTMLCQIYVVGGIVASSMIGVIPNVTSISQAGGFLREREGLGFTFATFAPNYFLSIAIEWLFLNKTKSNVVFCIQEIIIVIIDLFLYDRTGTRTTFFLVMCIVLISLIERINKSRKIFFEVLMKFFIENIYILASATMIALSVFYSSSIGWMENLNNALSQRLILSQRGLFEWGVSWFGKSVLWKTNASEYNYIDSSYINILICYGLIIFVIVVVGFSITAKYACRIKDYKLATALFIWAIRAMIDPQLFLMWFNPFVFYVAAAIFNQLKTIGVKRKYVISDLSL